MAATSHVTVSTFLYGLGRERQANPVFVPLSEQTISARNLIAAHVRAEVARAATARSESLALHYLLAADVRAAPPMCSALDAETEVARAWDGFDARHYLISVDGDTVEGLDQALTLSERSQICFVRLIPLVGG